MEVHSYPTLLWGTAGRFVAAFEDSSEIQNLHKPTKENGKKVEEIVKDIDEFFGVPAVEVLSSSVPGAPASPPTALLLSSYGPYLSTPRRHCHRTARTSVWHQLPHSMPQHLFGNYT
jgi:hypothetical protein